jgi:hypothetical protein
LISWSLNTRIRTSISGFLMILYTHASVQDEFHRTSEFGVGARLSGVALCQRVHRGRKCPLDFERAFFLIFRAAVSGDNLRA